MYIVFRCTICDRFMRVDEAQVSPDEGESPFSPLSALPEDWRCPRCGAGRSSLEIVPGAGRREDDRPD